MPRKAAVKKLKRSLRKESVGSERRQKVSMRVKRKMGVERDPWKKRIINK